MAAVAIFTVTLLATTALAAPAGMGPGANLGPDANPGPGAGGPGMGGPGAATPVDPSEVAGTYTCDNEDDLVLNADGTLTKGGVSCGFTVGKKSDPGGNISYPVTLEADDATSEALGLPWYGGTFNVDPDTKTYTIAGTIMNALITDKSAYSAVSVANPDTKTGYTTTFYVEDDGYDNVYIYGRWLPLPWPDDVYDVSTYLGEGNWLPFVAWENGMYYNGQSGLAATKNADGDWELTVDLASSLMNIVAFHDVARESDVEPGIMIPESDYVIAEIPYDSEKQSKSYDMTMGFVNKHHAGTVEYSIPFTTADGTSIPLSVYTPYGYNAADTSVKYPVLYMIPGAGTTERTFFENCVANNIFDNYIENGTVGATIVVTMEGMKAGSYMASDIIPYIEANYNVAADADHRALMGVSMGSVTSSGIYLDEEQVGMYARYCFLSGADKAVFGATDYPELDAEYLAKLSAPEIFIGAGGKDDFNMVGGQGNSTGTVEMKAWFEHYGIDITCSVAPGNHHWETWIPLTIEFVGEHLSDSTWQPVTSSLGAYMDKAMEKGWITAADGAETDEAITREQFAVMLWRAMGSVQPGIASPFSDVDSDAVTALYKSGIVQGIGNGLFAPKGTLTREMGAVMLTRAYKLSGSGTAVEGFTDAAAISGWAREAMAAMVEKGYMAGTGGNQLSPSGTLTWGMAAKLLVLTNRDIISR